MRRLTLGIAAAVALTVGDVAAAAPLPNLAATDAGIVRTAVPRSTGGGTFSVSQGQRLLAFDRAGGGVEVVDRNLQPVRVMPTAAGPALAGDLRN